MDKVCNHSFMGCTNFSFHGSSICEGGNVTIKYGDHKCKATHSLELSGLNQLHQAETREMEANKRIAKQVNAKKLWSKTETSDLLTHYMEGLVCNMMDSVDKLVVCYVGNHSWYVVRRNVIEQCEDGTDNKVSRFDRVRIVTINSDNFMSC